MFQRPVPGHHRLVRFFGLRLQLVVSIVAAGVAGGAIGTAYLWILDRVDESIGPHRWDSTAAQIALLVGVGACIPLLVRVLGRPASVELVVDNIHVPDRDQPSTARLRSLVPISLLCIGAGGTLGPEAPVVTAAGTVSHRTARARTTLDRDHVRVVTITGMAAGFAVLFGAPFGAALFALEIPHRRGISYSQATIPAVMGATIGYCCSLLTRRHGLEPVWSFAISDHIDPSDLAWAVLAGAIGACIAALFTLMTAGAADAAARVPSSVRPALGGLALGLLAWWSPFALTNGEFQIDAVVATVGVGALATAAAAKLAAASLAVATGWRGGFIIPLFFVGFTVGLLIAEVFAIDHRIVFALGVMAAANVGVTKTPLGSTLVVTEMSGTTIAPTTLIASLVSLVLTSPVGLIHAQREPIDAYRDEHGKSGEQPAD